MIKCAEMTSKERVRAVINGQEPDYLPVLNPTTLVTFELMQRTGCYFPQAHLDADKMAALAAAGHNVCGFDSLMPYLSIHLEAAALGCEIDWGNVDRLPAVTGYPVQDAAAFKVPPNFLDRKPIKALLSAIKTLRQKYGADVPIIGKVVGPWTLAYHLYGVANFLMDVILAPDRVAELIATLKEVPLAFAQAQIEAGADMVTWSDHVTGSLVSRKTYEDFLFPVHVECLTSLKDVPCILHVCGDVLDRLDLFARTGFGIFHIDSRNSLPEARRITDGRMLLTGNINNPRVLLNGGREDVRQEAARAVREGIRLISPECGLPTRVPNANLVELVKTVRRLSGARRQR